MSDVIGQAEVHGQHDLTRPLRVIATGTAVTGGLLFLLGVVLHPARDGAGVYAAGWSYGLTHSAQAVGLLLLASWLVSMYVLAAPMLGRRGL